MGDPRGTWLVDHHRLSHTDRLNVCTKLCLSDFVLHVTQAWPAGSVMQQLWVTPSLYVAFSITSLGHFLSVLHSCVLEIEWLLVWICLSPRIPRCESRTSFSGLVLPVWLFAQVFRGAAQCS